MNDTAAPAPTDVLVSFVLDKSGSMGRLAPSTIEGFNSFVEQQRTGDGHAMLSLTLFSNDFDVRFVARDIDEVPPLGSSENPYSCHGGTALYDAVRVAIEGTDAWLSAHPARAVRPVVAIQTDGGENASVVLSGPDGLDRLNELIAEKTKSGWEFVFLGTGEAAWTEGQKFTAIPESAKFARSADAASNNAMYAGMSASLHKTRSSGMAYAAALAEDLPEADRS